MSKKSYVFFSFLIILALFPIKAVASDVPVVLETFDSGDFWGFSWGDSTSDVEKIEGIPIEKKETAEGMHYLYQWKKYGDIRVSLSINSRQGLFQGMYIWEIADTSRVNADVFLAAMENRYGAVAISKKDQYLWITDTETITVTLLGNAPNAIMVVFQDTMRYAFAFLHRYNSLDGEAAWEVPTKDSQSIDQKPETAAKSASIEPNDAFMTQDFFGFPWKSTAQQVEEALGEPFERTSADGVSSLVYHYADVHGIEALFVEFVFDAQGELFTGYYTLPHDGNMVEMIDFMQQSIMDKYDEPDEWTQHEQLYIQGWTVKDSRIVCVEEQENGETIDLFLQYLDTAEEEPNLYGYFRILDDVRKSTSEISANIQPALAPDFRGYPWGTNIALIEAAEGVALDEGLFQEGSVYGRFYEYRNLLGADRLSATYWFDSDGALMEGAYYGDDPDVMRSNAHLRMEMNIEEAYGPPHATQESDAAHVSMWETDATRLIFYYEDIGDGQVEFYLMFKDKSLETDEERDMFDAAILR